MKVCLCLALLVASALSSPIGDTRIIGGVDAASHSHPWQASLQMLGRHICGASVISDKWLITAAHCVEGQLAFFLTVKVAEHDITDTEETSVTHRISQVIMHEGYNDGSYGAYPNDIALLRVSDTINLSDKTAAIKLPGPEMDFYGNPNCKISGWGRKDDSNGNLVDAPVLQELDVVIKSKEECVKSWDSNINDGHICVANGEHGFGACNGDSGGPLSCEVNGEMYLAGATSWGYNGCMTTGYPSVYTRISYFRNWIYEKTMLY